MPIAQPGLEEDWALLRAAREGDHAAWEGLWLSHRDRLYRVALSVCGDREAARDAVQSVFLRLITQPPPHEDSLAGWLSTAVWRAALAEGRRGRRHAKLEEAPAGSACSTEEEVERAERVNDALEALAQLPEAQRQVLALRLVAGLTYDETARLLEIPVGTVRSRLFNGVAACRDWLRRKGRLA